MVIGRIKEALKKMREQKEQQDAEEQKLESYRQSEEMKKAEQIKKEADRLAHLKQYKHAIDEYKKALEAFPYDPKEASFRKPADFFFKLFYNMAASYSYMNLFKDSIQYFDNALNIEGIEAEKKVKALMGKGNSYFLARQLLNLDENVYKTQIEQDFEMDEKTTESLKKLDEKKGLLNLAHECFSNAVEADKNHADAWYKKGHMEFLMNQVKDSMLSFDNVLMLDKNFLNREKIELFDDIKREKGLEVKYADFDSKVRFKAKTGHLVKNNGEMIIANFLFDNGLAFQYDVAVTWAEKDDFHAAFFIPKLDLYLEHFKYDQIKDYQKLMKWKAKQYDKHKKKMVCTNSQDEKHLEEVLKMKLKPYVVL